MPEDSSAPQRRDKLVKVPGTIGFRYFIDPISQWRSPFINRGESGNMDLQLNVFAMQRRDGREFYLELNRIRMPEGVG